MIDVEKIKNELAAFDGCEVYDIEEVSNVVCNEIVFKICGGAHHEVKIVMNDIEEMIKEIDDGLYITFEANDPDCSCDVYAGTIRHVSEEDDDDDDDDDDE